MSDAAAERRHLILVVGKENVSSLPTVKESTEVFVLTAENAREALEKIFAADSVAVWGALEK